VSARLARLALALYPLAYRRRYGGEMKSLLEDGGATPATVVDLTRGALFAHLRPEPGVAGTIGADERLRRGLAAVLGCWLVFALAGLALYKTTEGRPFEGVSGTPGVLGALHLAIQLLAAVGGVAVVVGAAPFVVAALRGGRPRNFARRGSLSVEPSHRAFALASACAALAAAAMAGIAALTAAYLVALATGAPDLAGEPNGPFGTPDVAISLVLQLTLMVAVAGPAGLAAVRVRRTFAR
jgi:hypothetical protein